METEITWDDPRIFDLPNGQLTIDGDPYEGWVVEVVDDQVVARDRFANGVREGESLTFSGGDLTSQRWYRKGALEGPALTIVQGRVVEAQFFARGTHLLTHSLTGGNWVETFRADPESRESAWARKQFGG